MVQNVRIIADHREAPSGVVEALRRIEGVEVEVRPLKQGDYWLANGVIVERGRLPSLDEKIKCLSLNELSRIRKTLQ